MKTQTIHNFSKATAKVISLATCALTLSVGARSLPVRAAQPHDTGHAPRSAIGPGERFRVTFTRLHCSNADEDGWLSNGDEPYVIFASLVPANNLAGFQLFYARTRVYDNVDAGEDRNPNLVLVNQHVENTLAVAALLVEGDRTGRDAVYMAATTMAQEMFENAILNGVRDLPTLRDTVATALRDGARGAVALTPIDPDDIIGDPVSWTVSATTLDGLALNGSTTTNREARKSGVRYYLHFSVTRTQ